LQEKATTVLVDVDGGEPKRVINESSNCGKSKEISTVVGKIVNDSDYQGIQCAMKNSPHDCSNEEP